MGATAVLECRGLGCGYPGRPVLDGVEIALSAGEAVALLGPNGSGKSTLIRTLCRLLPAQSGVVRIQDRELSQMSSQEVALSVSVVPQEEAVPFPFTVRQMVTLGRLARSTGIFDTREDREAAEHAIEEAECGDLADRVVNELSGGERQRVLLARAIAQDTPVVLMDEPTAHLDAPHQLMTATLVRGMAAAGKAILSAVHDLNLASLLASRALLVAKGRVVLDADVETVLTSPLLDESYGAKFERVRTDAGRLLVVPASLS